MAIARGNLIIFDSAAVGGASGTGVVLGGTAGTTWTIKESGETGTVVILLDADALGQQAIAAAVPAGAPPIGASVFIQQSSTQQAPADGGQVWFVVRYVTTADNAAVQAVLQCANQPLLRVAVIATQITAFTVHP